MVAKIVQDTTSQVLVSRIMNSSASSVRWPRPCLSGIFRLPWNRYGAIPRRVGAVPEGRSAAGDAIFTGLAGIVGNLECLSADTLPVLARALA